MYGSGTVRVDEAGNGLCRFFAAGRIARPVIEVDDVARAVCIDDGISSIDGDSQGRACLVGLLF